MVLFGASEILILILGIAYGYVNPDQEDRTNLIKKGAIYGIVLGILLGVLVKIFFSIYIVYLIIAVTLVFSIGTLIGDILRKR